jgi:hypothetical protein
MVVPQGVKFHSDDSTAGVGEGTLTLTIDPSGRMTGTASGVLGDMTISGLDRGGDFAASLRPAAADGFTGTFIGSEPPPGAAAMTGTMNLSDGKNELVRTATVQLARK